ncbi:putative membrane protein (partial) [Candidatus Ichthyocystis hellenicum]|uniref:Putative membrane protein (Partial) n=1 Tax=Candidatus Ichthyocystis hellenicum TaxID=1561003 RepID=A0A0S4M2S6_9BURK|nr:putative membrane protein (partial) [Candidatus Ichthyocystis hellenicum]
MLAFRKHLVIMRLFVLLLLLCSCHYLHLGYRFTHADCLTSAVLLQYDLIFTIHFIVIFRRGELPWLTQQILIVTYR